MVAESLLERVERLKADLIARATGELSDDDEYRRLRIDLLSEPLVAAQLPAFVRRCRNLEEFWGFIKPKFGTYADRREYLRQEFDEVLTSLETNAAPVSMSGSSLGSVVDSEHVTAAWARAFGRIDADPEGAITAARSLLETVCKHILDDVGGSYSDKNDLPQLYSEVARHLRLAPSQHTELIFKQILGSAQSVVEGLGALRNRVSDAHGKSRSSMRPGVRHARLAVNFAGAISVFLVETQEARTSSAHKPEAT